MDRENEMKREWDRGNEAEQRMEYEMDGLNSPSHLIGGRTEAQDAFLTTNCVCVCEFIVVLCVLYSLGIRQIVCVCLLSCSVWGRVKGRGRLGISVCCMRPLIHWESFFRVGSVLATDGISNRTHILTADSKIQQTLNNTQYDSSSIKHTFALYS